jgi:predicted nuclease of predicted toxin-antitoxin system
VARLLADENFPLPVVERLRELGQEVVTLSDLGLSNQGLPDSEVLDLASREDRGLLTMNRLDFIRLHGTGRSHAGIVVCTFDRDFNGQAQRILDAVMAVGELSGALIRVNRPNP